MQFNVTISSDATSSPDAGQLSAGERQAILDTMNAAATMWSWYLTASNVTLDVAIEIKNSAYSARCWRNLLPEHLQASPNLPERECLQRQ